MCFQMFQSLSEEPPPNEFLSLSGDVEHENNNESRLMTMTNQMPKLRTNMAQVPIMIRVVSISKRNSLRKERITPVAAKIRVIVLAEK